MIKALKFITQINMLLMLLVVIIQVFFRYVLKYPLGWTEEIAVLLFIWLTFLGAVVVLNDDKHMYVDLLIEKLPLNILKILKKINLVLTLLFIIIATYSGVLMIVLTIHSKLAASRIPMLFYYLPVPLSMFLMTFIIAIAIYKTKNSLKEQQKEKGGIGF